MRVIVVPFIILFFLIVTPIAFAQTDSARTQERFRENRTELREQFKEQREELRKRLKNIRDKKKRTVVLRIQDKLTAVNKRRTDRMEKTLAKLRGILERISQKAGQAKANGKDTATVDVAIAQAQTALSTTEAAVNTQAAKQYTIQIESEEKLRSTVGTTVSGLQQDLRDTHKTVVDAKQKVQQAAKELAKLRGEKKIDEK